MSMVRFTYDDGENSAVVAWTPEYGFVAAGSAEILGNIEYAEVEPKGVAPVLELRPTVNAPDTAALLAAASEPVLGVGSVKCVVCGHFEPHEDPEGCTNGSCECLTAVYG